MVKSLLAAGIIALMLITGVAGAEVVIAPSPYAQANSTAALEFSASHAFVSEDAARAYYLVDEADGARLIVADMETNSYKTVHSFTDGAHYAFVAADPSGNIYMVSRNADETAKSKLVCLKPEDDYAYAAEFPFPAASGNLIPYAMEFSAQSLNGYTLVWISNGGEYVSALSVFSAFWGSLEGYDRFIVIAPGSLEAVSFDMKDYFDVYGYPNDLLDKYLADFESGELLSPVAASLSPFGDVLLLRADYFGMPLIYVMDIYTLTLELVYLPDDFSGSVGWSAEGALTATPDNGGEAFTLALSGFVEASDDDDWRQYDDGAGAWSDNATDGESDAWKDVDYGELADWS